MGDRLVRKAEVLISETLINRGSHQRSLGKTWLLIHVGFEAGIHWMWIPAKGIPSNSAETDGIYTPPYPLFFSKTFWLNLAKGN